MLEKLRQIDTSAIEKLVNIKKEQDLLNGYLDKSEDLKEKVDEIVYQRVRDDYQNRHRELEKEANPLQAEARRLEVSSAYKGATERPFQCGRFAF